MHVSVGLTQFYGNCQASWLLSCEDTDGLLRRRRRRRLLPFWWEAGGGRWEVAVPHQCPRAHPRDCQDPALSPALEKSLSESCLAPNVCPTSCITVWLNVKEEVGPGWLGFCASHRMQNDVMNPVFKATMDSRFGLPALPSSRIWREP